MKTKRLKKDEMRVICLDGDAVFELLTETMIDGAGDYFDLLDGRLLLVHGLDDDNVFFSNTTAYMQALIEKGIQFDMQVYPGKEHSLVGRSTRMHLFGKIVEFFDRELK